MCVKATYDIWVASMNMCRPGLPYNAIGEFIEDQCTSKGYTSIRGYNGHGIGAV